MTIRIIYNNTPDSLLDMKILKAMKNIGYDLDFDGYASFLGERFLNFTAQKNEEK